MAGGFVKRKVAEARLYAQSDKLADLLSDARAYRQKGKMPKARQLMTEALAQWRKECELFATSEPEIAEGPFLYKAESGIELLIEFAELLSGLSENQGACGMMKEARSLVQGLQYKLAPSYLESELERYDGPSWSSFPQSFIDGQKAKITAEIAKLNEQSKYIEFFLSRNCPWV